MEQDVTTLLDFPRDAPSTCGLSCGINVRAAMWHQLVSSNALGPALRLTQCAINCEPLRISSITITTAYKFPQNSRVIVATSALPITDCVLRLYAMVESYQDTRLSSPYSSILERDQYLGSDFARMMERGGHIATIEPTDSYEQAFSSTAEVHSGPPSVLPIIDSELLHLSIGPKRYLVQTLTYIFRISEANPIGGDHGSSSRPSSSSRPKPVTSITQVRFTQNRGANRYPLPKNPYSISFRAPGQAQNGVVATVHCDSSKIERAEELVFVDHETGTINIRFRPSAEFKSKGWSDWDGTINVKNGKTQDGKYNPITRRRLFELISGRFKGCIEGRRSSRVTKTPLINPFPTEVTLNRIEIRTIYQVSHGSFQVVAESVKIRIGVEQSRLEVPALEEFSTCVCFVYVGRPAGLGIVLPASVKNAA
ncbi:uncharacterized protein STEHIDRAFT_108012 [Stereum hirsutum FP-91666 SS1]|uniref:uncharacterized protein n=1 Tax=Stereum hirsutum (strain FP-91666) TaxID=721885 RepID=UPI000440FA44|nr:uncharacterized protein STEHIDRAFT_108012 [Stereum hirsutum FP-91666 SS1]EIM91463.1 hypothetical protein STEHIDRAFT_108012 [Stereum hirsutum FP-91666 SS1]